MIPMQRGEIPHGIPHSLYGLWGLVISPFGRTGRLKDDRVFRTSLRASTNLTLST